MTDPTPLCPAAQAVLDAALPHVVHRYSVAAALRAAADQVVPEEDIDGADYDCLQAKWMALGEQESRDRLLAIAAELEGGAE